jgi:hypothetical protein
LLFRDVYLGEKPTTQLAEDAITKIAKQALPINLEAKTENDLTKFLAQVFAPTILQPGVNVAINRTGLGNEIVKEAFLDKEKYRSEQGAPLTAEFYKDAAVTLRQLTSLDMAPEQIKELMNTVSLGMIRNFQQALVDNPNRELQGKPTKTPVLGSFYANTDNAAISEMNRFEIGALQLVQERNANPDFAPTPEQERILDLYENWKAAEKEFRKRGAAMTRAGVEKGVNEERNALRQERSAAQADIIRQFNQR